VHRRYIQRYFVFSGRAEEGGRKVLHILSFRFFDKASHDWAIQNNWSCNQNNLSGIGNCRSVCPGNSDLHRFHNTPTQYAPMVQMDFVVQSCGIFI